jgi:hypothetical protein
VAADKKADQFFYIAQIGCPAAGSAPLGLPTGGCLAADKKAYLFFLYFPC